MWDLPALLDLGVQRLVCGLVGRELVSPVTQGRVTFVSVLQSPDKIILKSLLFSNAIPTSEDYFCHWKETESGNHISKYKVGFCWLGGGSLHFIVMAPVRFGGLGGLGTGLVNLIELTK